ncbi:uncharacterized protein LOC133192417 [Saccostrea echinata]|uniref:uncharacterized protein LOC133192417 n=1 Tax=Saccostrea echinata TaxID=191078 RepID=UPI002A828594|nr:uncharacterized protein LOC133192417 [Saccostrea echinata]
MAEEKSMNSPPLIPETQDSIEGNERSLICDILDQMTMILQEIDNNIGLFREVVMHELREFREEMRNEIRNLGMENKRKLPTTQTEKTLKLQKKKVIFLQSTWRKMAPRLHFLQINHVTWLHRKLRSSENVRFQYGTVVFLTAEVEIFIKTPILYGKDSMTVYCEPQEESKRLIDSINMIRIYVEHNGGPLGSVASKLSRIVKNVGLRGYEIQSGPAKTARYNITGSISMVEKAYLGAYVKSEDVLCSDSRLFRCEMSFTFKNGTNATVSKDRATCVQGPCNECNFGIQNLEISNAMSNEDKIMKNYLLPTGGVLALFGTVSLVIGIVLTIKSISRQSKYTKETN